MLNQTENDLELLSKRIHDNIAQAMSQENPLVSLGNFCRVTIPKRECDEDSQISSLCEGKILFFKSPLPQKIEQQCIQLFERNMGNYYKKSSWGLNLKEKKKELRHPDARFLILAQEDGENLHESSDNVMAFSHFRFEVNDDNYPTEEVMYVYELQVNQLIRGRGVGKKFMTIMELLAMKSKMRKVVLTVFKNNTQAMHFYRIRMKYGIDDFSPSNYVNDDADYEILSKCVHREQN